MSRRAFASLFGLLTIRRGRHRRRTLSRRTVAVASAAVLVTGLAPVFALTNAQAVTNPVTVTMTPSANPVNVGQQLTYTIVATTTSPQQTNVALQDQITGLTNVVLTSSRGFCTFSSQLVSCSAGSIPNQGETWTVTITGTVTAGAGTYLSNTATVTGNWSQNNVGQAFSVSVSTNVQVVNTPTSPLADLSVALSGPSTVSPSQDVIDQLTVYNSGGANATDVKVVATLPNGWSITPTQSVNGTSLFSCSVSLPTITCVGGAVNAGANATITIPAHVSPTTASTNGAIGYTTTAIVNPEQSVAESNYLNNTSSLVQTVPVATASPTQVLFTKTASSPVDTKAGTQVRPGDTLTYTIVTKNASTSNKLTRVQISDGTQGLDQSAVSVKSSDTGLICTNSNNLVTCAAANNNYTLNPGQQVTVTVAGRVVQPPSSIITNTATVKGLQGKTSVTLTASVTTIVRPAVDLTVTQYATCPVPSGLGATPELLKGTKGGCLPFRGRNQFDYLITVGNSGLNDAGPSPSVVLREPLPPDVIFEGYDNLSPSGGFTCAVDTSNVVTCTGGTVPGQINGGLYQGTIRQLRLHLTAPDSVGPITGTITVNPFNAIPESDTTNNTATTTQQIQTGVDLSITQSLRCPRDTRPPASGVAFPMCDPAAPSGTLIYDIVVTNFGTQDASGIAVQDLLPKGTQFRSAKEVGPPPPFLPFAVGTPYTPVHGLSCNSPNSTEVDCSGGYLKGIYAAYGNPAAVTPGTGSRVITSGTPDFFVIEVTAFAPAPYGPNSSPSATGSPILNQVLVDPSNTIPEYDKTNNLNILETNVGIPPDQPLPGSIGDWGTYNELTVNDAQTRPVDGSGNPLAVAPNGNLNYTLTVSNWGSDPVSNVTVYDYIPNGARFRDVSAAPLSGGTGGFSCSFNNQNAAIVQCTNGALAASPNVGTPAFTTIVIHLFAPPTPSSSTTVYTNHAVVDPNNTVPEADETNNASDAALTVQLPVLGALHNPTVGGQDAYNELTVDNVQTNPASGAVAPYGTLDYTLTAKNWGTDPVTGVTLYDYIPNGAQFRNVTTVSGGFVCSYNSGLVTCNNGSLAPAVTPEVTPSTGSITIRLFAPGTTNDAAGSTNQYTNHVVINPNNTIPEADPTNDVTDTNLTVSYPTPDGTGQNAYNEFTISTTQAWPSGGVGSTVAPGGTLYYKVIVQNTGSDLAVNVPVRDILPPGTTFRAAQLDPASMGGVTGFACSQSNGIVDCTNGTLPPGAVAIIDILTFAPTQPTTPGSSGLPASPSPSPAGFNIQNQAIVNPNQTVQEADPTNDTSTVTTLVQEGGAAAYYDLTSSLTGSDKTGQPDQPIHYTLTVTNQGTDDLYNATVSDTLPAGTVFQSAVDSMNTAGQFTCSVSGQVITCTGGTLLGTYDNGGMAGQRVINIVANAPHADGAIIDQAMADPNNQVVEGDKTNNSSQFSTDVESVINLSVSIDMSDSISQGTDGYINGSITNTAAGLGSATAQNVQSVWNLPVGVTLLDTNAPAGTTCTTSQNPVNQIVCVTSSLAPGSPAPFKFHVYNNQSGTENDSANVNANLMTIESDTPPDQSAPPDPDDVANGTVTG